MTGQTTPHDTNPSDAATTALRPTESRRLTIGALGILGLTAVLWWLSGTPALIASLVLTAVWYVGSAPYAVAGAHVALVALIPAVPLAALVAFEASALVVLLGDVWDPGGGVPVGTALASAVCVGGLAAIGYVTLETTGRSWAVGLLLGLVAAVSAYGLHRYAIVRRYHREGTDE